MALHCPALLAYLDPGTGSIMLQVVLGAIAASGVAISLMWRRICGLAARFVARKSDSAPEEKK